jgi:hypothetical protein
VFEVAGGQPALWAATSACSMVDDTVGTILAERIELPAPDPHLVPARSRGSGCATLR